MKQTKAKESTIRKYENLQLRQRIRGRSVNFFLSYTLDGAQKREFLKTVSISDKQGIKIALAECAEIARQRDGQLAQGLIGTAFIRARNQSFIEFAGLVMKTKRTPEPYHKALLKLRAYLATLNRTDLTFAELTPSFCVGFRDYLVSLVDAGEISGSTAAKYLEKVKHILFEALRRELVVKNPFLSVKRIATDTPEREFLTLSEIERLLQTPLPETRKYDAQLYADYFLFICLTGIRPNDVRELTFQNVQTTDGQNFHLAFVPSKTKHKTAQILIVPLHPFAVKILERQRARQAFWSVDNRIFEGLPPKTSPNVVNAFLKVWLRKAGIEKSISLYNGRHSFASNLLLSGAGIVEVSRLLGHTSLRHTGVYSHLTDDSKRVAVNRLQITEPIHPAE